MGFIKMLKNIHILCLFLLFSLKLSLAEDPKDNGSPENLIVYGTRLQQPTVDVGSNISVLTAGDIKALGSNYLVDSISSLPGVTVNQNGSFGGTATVRIRGASSEQTLVIIDGVIVNDPTSPGGGFDFSRIDPSNVERIEVLRGPQSTLWGTDAMGGVINIITKRPEKGINKKVFAQAGSFNTFRSGAEFNQATDTYNLRLAATAISSDGISKADEINGNSEKDGYDAKTINAAAGIELWEDARLQTNFLWTDAKSDFDSYTFGAQGSIGDGNEYSKTEELNANLKFLFPLLNGKLENVLLAGFSDIERESFNAGVSSFASEGSRNTFQYQGTLKINEMHRFAFGAEHEKNKANENNSSVNGLFALYEFKAFDSLVINAGLRLDDHNRYSAVTTSRFSLAFNPHDQITLLASWDEGFKSPTIFQTTFFCCGATSPNSNLKPESSESFNIGVIYQTLNARGKIGLTYFDQDTTNLINYSSGSYENIASAASSGVEIDSNFIFTEWFSANLNFTYLNAKDSSGNKLARVPERSGDLSLILKMNDKISGSLRVKYNGEEQDSNGIVASWSRTDLTSNYIYNDSLEIYARIENIFDKQYQQIIGYGTPGISGHLGARFGF